MKQSEAAGLAQVLRAAGYAVLPLPTSESFGDEQHFFVKSPLRIEVGSDRGEWYVSISHEGWGTESYGTDLWSACLDGQEPVNHPVSIAQQIEFIRERLTDVERTVSDNPGEVLECLRSKGLERAARRYGIPDQ